MENSEKVIEKIDSGAFKNIKPQNGKKGKIESKKIEKAEEPASTQGDKNGKANVSSEPKPDAPKVEKPKAEKAPEASKASEAPERKVANFPVKAHINQYGFIGFNVSICNALNLPINQAPYVKGEVHPKLAADVPIELCTYDPATKILSIKILL